MKKMIKKTRNLLLASMMAISSLALLPFAKVSAADLVEENLINKTASDVTIVSYTSECIPFTNMPDDSRASYVLDKNPNTHWHSAWKDQSTGSAIGGLPESITFDLGAEYDLSDITFLCRQDRETWSGNNNVNYNGDITEAKVYVGNDVNDLTLIGTYTFETTGSGTSMMLANRTEYKRIELEATGRYVKFEATKSCADTSAGQNQWASMAEINFYKAGEAVVNKTALEEKIAEAEALDATAYTDESYAAVTEVLDAAKAVVANEAATQAEVDAAKDRLVAAMNALVAIPKAPEAVTVNVAQKDYQTVTLTWEASEGATSYEVYRKAYKETSVYTLNQTVEGTTAEISKLMTGKTYSYYVVAKNEVGSSANSNEVTFATQLEGVPTLSIEQVSATKFTLKWTEIDGATRYIIYRKRAHEDKEYNQYRKVLTLKGSQLEYTTAEMPHGDYSFILRAGRYDSSDRVMTDKSNAVEGKVDAVAPTVTAKAGAKKATISWDKMSGVTTYIVYRSTSKNGSYKKIVTTKETSVVDTGLSSGKSYYYKVKGFKKYKSGTELEYNVYTPASDPKKATIK